MWYFAKLKMTWNVVVCMYVHIFLKVVYIGTSWKMFVLSLKKSFLIIFQEGDVLELIQVNDIRPGKIPSVIYIFYLITYIIYFSSHHRINLFFLKFFSILGFHRHYGHAMVKTSPKNPSPFVVVWIWSTSTWLISSLQTKKKQT